MSTNKDAFLVPFTQFLMPNGTRTLISIAMEEPYASQARSLIRSGAHFELELLSDWATVSMECLLEETVLSGCLVANGPGVKEAVCLLIKQAAETFEALRDSQRVRFSYDPTTIPTLN